MGARAALLHPKAARRFGGGCYNPSLSYVLWVQGLLRGANLGVSCHFGDGGVTRGLPVSPVPSSQAQQSPRRCQGTRERIRPFPQHRTCPASSRNLPSAAALGTGQARSPPASSRKILPLTAAFSASQIGAQP